MRRRQSNGRRHRLRTPTDEIHRDGALLLETDNDGSHVDVTTNRGGASYSYRVCESGGESCSETTTVVY